MKEKYGIILIDENTIITRIYETDNKEWNLSHYEEKKLSNQNPHPQGKDLEIAEIIAKLFSSPYTSRVVNWKISARKIPEQTTKLVSSIIGIEIENLTHTREQELLCKGTFIELW